tara:strand:- start:845 stop:1051 length:207 start_codon:yes stop_codon:yes gene_type:complete
MNSIPLVITTNESKNNNTLIDSPTQYSPASVVINIDNVLDTKKSRRFVTKSFTQTNKTKWQQTKLSNY